MQSRKSFKLPDDILQFGVLDVTNNDFVLGSAHIYERFLSRGIVDIRKPFLGLVTREGNTDFKSAGSHVAPRIISTHHSWEYIKQNALIRSPFSVRAEPISSLTSVNLFKLIELVAAARFSLLPYQMVAVQMRMERMEKNASHQEIRVALREVLRYIRFQSVDRSAFTEAIDLLKVNYGKNVFSVISTRTAMENPVAVSERQVGSGSDRKATKQTKRRTS